MRKASPQSFPLSTGNFKPLSDISSDEQSMLEDIMHLIKQIPGYEDYFQKLFKIPKYLIQQKEEIMRIQADCKEFKKHSAFKLKSQKELCINIAKIYDNNQRARDHDYSRRFSSIMEQNCQSSSSFVSGSKSYHSQGYKFNQSLARSKSKENESEPIVQEVFYLDLNDGMKPEEIKIEEQKSVIVLQTEKIMNAIKKKHWKQYKKSFKSYFKKGICCCCSEIDRRTQDLLDDQKKPVTKQYRKALAKIGLSEIRDIETLDMPLVEKRMKCYCQQLYNEFETNKELILENELKLVKIFAAVDIILFNRQLYEKGTQESAKPSDSQQLLAQPNNSQPSDDMFQNVAGVSYVGYQKGEQDKSFLSKTDDLGKSLISTAAQTNNQKK